MWSGGGGRGEWWEKGERKGTCTNIRTHMYVCTYIRMQWHMHSHMRTNGHIVHQQTSYECVRTYVRMYVSDARAMYVFCINICAYTIE